MSLDNSNKLKLWYDEPASAWVEALPLGNGKLGAMVYGDPFHENIQVNEETIWSSGENNSVNPNAKALISEIQKSILDGNLKQADLLAKEAYTGNMQGSYQTLGNIMLNFTYGEDKKTVHSYRRELDLETALSKVRYSIGGVNYRVESLISAVDNVFAMSMKSTEGRTIQLEAALNNPEKCNISAGSLPLSLLMKGSCADNSINYCAMIKIIPSFNNWGKPGNAAYKDGKLIIENASDLIILFTAATDFNTENHEKVCIERLELAEQKGFEAIKADHIHEYAQLFKKMSISLGEDKFYDFIPTNERLMRVTDGGTDNSLVALYYQYGRYLLISSSRKNSELPANLQGIWNDMTFAPWGSRFTININTEMNYWVAEQCNLSECHEPLFRLIDKIKQKGRITAREMYGCRGFVSHHNTNIWGDTSPQDSYPTSTYWPMGAAWLCLHLWDRYEFTRDKDFLKKAYTTMKEACEFFEDFLIEDKKGRLVTCPSLSPENIYKTADGYATAICAGPTMDNAILRKLFDCTIKSSHILGLDNEYADKLADMKSRLPEIKVGRYGTIMEWPEDYEETEIGHRHISQLFALYPAGEITVNGTPELAAAAKKTLERRLSHGGGHTGWSCAWIINMWARLWDSENAFKYVNNILAKSTYPNLFDAHPPFQIDGNLGAAAGITEMLLQSNDDTLNLLPALPNEWPDGHIKGVRARGNCEIALEWNKKQLTKAVINVYGPEAVSILKVRYANINSYVIKCNDEIIPFTTLDSNLITFKAAKGKQYTLEIK